MLNNADQTDNSAEQAIEAVGPLDFTAQADLAEVIAQEISQSWEQVANTLVKNVAASSRRIYLADARAFVTFLTQQRGATIETATFEDASFYRAYLSDHFKPQTAARMLVVARRLLEVAVIMKLRPDNPAYQLKGFKTGSASEDDSEGVSNTTPHRALNRSEAERLLAKVDRHSLKGKRDFALLLLLVRTGLRRAECAALTVGDIGTRQGHTVLTVRFAKGGKTRLVKLPVDVKRALDDYLSATNPDPSQHLPAEAPLFMSFRKGDHPSRTRKPMDGLAIERVVTRYAALAELEGLTPHGLRATFVTLALEGGAKLQQVQYAVGHADPRTTERYQKRKLNLDENAVDFVFVNVTEAGPDLTHQKNE